MLWGKKKRREEEEEGDKDWKTASTARKEEERRRGSEEGEHLHLFLPSEGVETSHKKRLGGLEGEIKKKEKTTRWESL